MKKVILIPCFNEAKTICKVIRDFKAEVPEAEIIVFDNNSTDDSARLAEREEVRVITIKRRGKGYVIQRMFEMIEADIYILVDGDDTYFAKDVHQLIKPVLEDDADMVIGKRVLLSDVAMKKINKIGNSFFSYLIGFCFRREISDVLSGYRVMSKYLIHNIPILTHEFQVEMELTIQSLYRGMRIKEIPVSYQERPSGSISKLHPLKDGTLVLLTLLALVRDLMPLAFFGSIAVVLLIGILGYGLFVYFAQRQATLLDTVIITSFTIIAWLFISMGLFLHTINRRFIELNTIIRRKK